MPSSEAISRGPHPVLRRASETRSWIGLARGAAAGGGVPRSGPRGRREIGAPPSPACRQRQDPGVGRRSRDVRGGRGRPNVRCSSSTSATRRCLPFGVSGALRCCIRVLLEVLGVEYRQPLGGPGSTSWRSERGESGQLAGPARRSRAPSRSSFGRHTSTNDERTSGRRTHPPTYHHAHGGRNGESRRQPARRQAARARAGGDRRRRGRGDRARVWPRPRSRSRSTASCATSSRRSPAAPRSRSSPTATPRASS